MKSLSQYFIDQCYLLIPEHASAAKDMKRQSGSIAIVLLEHIAYVTLYNDHESVNHWKDEIINFTKPIAQRKVKHNNSYSSRKRLLSVSLLEEPFESFETDEHIRYAIIGAQDHMRLTIDKIVINRLVHQYASDIKNKYIEIFEAVCHSDIDRLIHVVRHDQTFVK